MRDGRLTFIRVDRGHAVDTSYECEWEEENGDKREQSNVAALLDCDARILYGLSALIERLAHEKDGLEVGRACSHLEHRCSRKQ